VSINSEEVHGADSLWLSAAVIAVTTVAMVFLFRGRSWYDGVIALGAIGSPSIMMGVERGKFDLLILALVGTAALIYEERRVGCAYGAITFIVIGVALKLFPVFCVSLAARFSRQTFIFACATGAISLIYLNLIMKYVFLIRRNVPTTFILSFGYKTILLGVDHIRSDAGSVQLGWLIRGCLQSQLQWSLFVPPLLPETASATSASFAPLIYLPPGLRSCSGLEFIVAHI